MKLNQVISDNTRQTKLWQELRHKEDIYKIEVMNLMQSFKHELRNSQRCSNIKMNDIEQLLHTLRRIYTPLNQNEGTIISNPQVLNVENSQLKNEFSTCFHNLDPSIGQELLKEVPKLKEWPHFSDILVTARFNTLFTRSAHRWFIEFRQAHGHQSWTWLKPQIINKWANDVWRFKVETAFESSKFDSEIDRALPFLFQQKYRSTALYTDMSEFIIHRKVLRECVGDLENSVKRRTTEKSSEEDIINILEEVTTRTRIGTSRFSPNTRFNTP
ncbi:hypothetical protein O181_067686 [Austropuccinia psidii MF-1]|uniref:Uncharacterized protein n=1 Tax=Austropuccinia psidii MF-1 TaxID=1389203 RepID=A0A9Q3ETE2_9BASI|nr:hypothetical protein [Austropuccinia psidii MF-1]